jgi:signal transduction histidine kinase
VAQAKELVTAAIARAQADLDKALSELEKIPAVNMSTVAYSAHALNNYLTVTGAAVELMLQHLRGHPDPQLQAWLEGLQHATHLMIRTVSQLLSTSTTAETVLRFERVDLSWLVQRLCTYYERVAEQKSIRLDVDPAGDVPPVWTDRVGVAAVLDNLLSNAIKFTESGKHVSVRVQGEKDGAVCSVRDQGPGLSEADQARLFQKGVKLTPRPTAGEPSTGYGLAVARELIEKLGGTIWCESVLGQGCCFSFRVPAYQEPTPAPGGPETEDPG